MKKETVRETLLWLMAVVMTALLAINVALDNDWRKDYLRGRKLKKTIQYRPLRLRAKWRSRSTISYAR